MTCWSCGYNWFLRLQLFRVYSCLLDWPQFAQFRSSADAAMPNDNEALSAAGSTVLFREWRVSPNILKMSNNKMNAVTLKPQSNKSDDSSLSYWCLFCKFAHDDCWDFLVGRKPQLDQSLSCYLCFSRTTRTCFNSPDSPLWQDAHWLISTETLAHTDGIILAHGHGCQVESLFPTSTSNYDFLHPADSTCAA